MENGRRRRLSCIIGALAVLALCTTLFADGEADGPAPVKHEGRKWRIGYFEGGSYYNYRSNLLWTVHNLAALGWMDPVQFPDIAAMENDRDFWEWLCDNTRSEYIEFVRDAFWSSEFHAELRAGTRAAVLERLNGKKDIDLMIAMGTWAGQDMANDEYHVPTIVCSVSNAIESGIVRSAEDSGHDHLVVRVDPTRYMRQVQIFHDIFHFKKLGVVYEDSPEGRTYGAFSEIHQVAAEKGFEVVSCLAPFSNVGQPEADEAAIACYRELAPKVDAVFITTHRGVNAGSLPTIMKALERYDLPTFAMNGSKDVEAGALMSIEGGQWRYAGRFYATVIAKILNGVKPRSIDQRCPDPARLAVNIQAIKNIGYEIPLDLLCSIEEFYGADNINRQ